MRGAESLKIHSADSQGITRNYEGRSKVQYQQVEEKQAIMNDEESFLVLPRRNAKNVFHQPEWRRKRQYKQWDRIDDARCRLHPISLFGILDHAQ